MTVNSRIGTILEQAMNARDRITNIIELLEWEETERPERGQRLEDYGDDKRYLEAVYCVRDGNVHTMILDGNVVIMKMDEYKRLVNKNDF